MKIVQSWVVFAVAGAAFAQNAANTPVAQSTPHIKFPLTYEIDQTRIKELDEAQDAWGEKKITMAQYSEIRNLGADIRKELTADIAKDRGTSGTHTDITQDQYNALKQELAQLETKIHPQP